MITENTETEIKERTNVSETERVNDALCYLNLPRLWKTYAIKFQNGGNPKHTLRLIHAQANVRF